MKISSFLLLSRFFSLLFESLIIICLGVNPLNSFLLEYFKPLGCLYSCIHQIWEMFSNYFLKFSLLPSLNNFDFFLCFLNLVISIVLYSGLRIFFTLPVQNLQILLVNYFSCIFQFQNLFSFFKRSLHLYWCFHFVHTLFSWLCTHLHVVLWK